MSSLTSILTLFRFISISRARRVQNKANKTPLVISGPTPYLERRGSDPYNPFGLKPVPEPISEPEANKPFLFKVYRPTKRVRNGILGLVFFLVLALIIVSTVWALDDAKLRKEIDGLEGARDGTMTGLSSQSVAVSSTASLSGLSASTTNSNAVLSASTSTVSSPLFHPMSTSQTTSLSSAIMTRTSATSSTITVAPVRFSNTTMTR